MDHNKHRKVNTSSQLLRSSKLSRLGIASCIGLTGLIVTTLFCPVSSHVHAAETVPVSENVLTSDTASISIAIDDTMVAVSLNPNENNGFAAGSTKVRVTTDNSSGYKLSMSTLDGTSNLSRDDGLDSQIQAVSGTVSPNSFTDNTWGYNLAEGDTSGTDFQAVPGTASNVAETDSANTDTWTLTFGAKVSKTLPAGEYRNKVIISAVANPVILTGLDRIDTMQAMTHEICEQANIHNSKQLTDVRDGKSYWVAKLADGNCWMTQNLALDITTAGLDSTTSDLGYSNGSYPVMTKYWNSSSTYAPTYTETSIPPNKETDHIPTATRSWNLGAYYEQIHDGSKDCGSAYNLSDCVGANKILDLTPNSNDLEKLGAEGAKHYLIGNYYQWNTATAGTGGTLASGQAVDSICPKNWKLPTGNNTDYGSFTRLLDRYGFYRIANGTGSVTGYTNPATNQPYNIAEEPLFFVRSGEIVIFGPYLFNAGESGRYWSSTPHANGQNAYIFGFSRGAGVSPSGSLGRDYGFPVRCLAR